MPKTDKNTTKLLEDNVMAGVGTMPQNDTKPISLEHIKVVNNYVDGMTKIASYKKVYEAPDSKMSDDTATKGVARVLARPEVKEYLAERIGEIEAMTKISKSKVVQTLVEIMTGSKYREKVMVDEKVQISAAAQISKMMGYDAPIKTETKTFTLEQLAEKLLTDD
jgi:Terminase small subunit